MWEDYEVAILSMFLAAIWMPIALFFLLQQRGKKKRFYVGIFLNILIIFISAFVLVNEFVLVIDWVLMAFVLYFVMRCSVFELIYIPVSYILVVLGNYIVEVVGLSITGVTKTQLFEEYPYMTYSLLGVTILVFLFSLLLNRIIRYIRKLIENKHRKELLLLFIGNVILCTLVFLVNGWAARQAGFPFKVLQTNLILFGTYTVLMIAISLTVLKLFMDKERMEREKEQYESLMEYTSQIEKMYMNLRTFKHDYVNILTTMSGYLEAKDYDGLENYFDQNILPTNQRMSRDNYRLNQLSNIKEPALKGLVSSKLMYAHEMEYDIYIDIMEEIEHISMNIIDLSRIMGIYLDNAIEAAGEAEDKEIKFNIVKEEKSVTFIIMNTFVNHGVILGNLGKNGYSTKGAERGIGLYNVKEVLHKYDNVFKTTEIKGNYFIQTLVLQN